MCFSLQKQRTQPVGFQNFDALLSTYVSVTYICCYFTFFYLSNDQLLTIMNIKKSSHLENRILVLKVHMQTEMYYQSVQVYHKFIYLKIS